MTTPTPPPVPPPEPGDHCLDIAALYAVCVRDRHFGMHDEGCAAVWDKYADDHRCDCGIDAVRVGLPAALRRLAAAEANAAHYRRERDGWIDDANALRDRYDALSRDCSAVQRRVAEVETELAGYRKAEALWNAGMESTCRHLDRLKQESRSLRTALSALVEAAARWPVASAPLAGELAAARAALGENHVASGAAPPYTQG